MEKVKRNAISPKTLKRLLASVLSLATIAGTMTACRTEEADKTDSTEPTSIGGELDPTEAIQTQTVNSIRDNININSKEGIQKLAIYLIEEAARCGQKLDAEDAVLTVITANIDKISNGFMGELFGPFANQTYTYGHLVDAYLRTAMMQVENIGVGKTNDTIFNIEDIFVDKEDYEYLCEIRELTTRFINSTDAAEKAKITAELNNIAKSLCTHDTFDISSSASVLSMLCLDGMRIVTTNSNAQVLPDDIRDEVFGTGDYACTKEGKFENADGQVIQAQYSYRVNDLKLDGVFTKLYNAILEEGKTTILDEIIDYVAKYTKDVKVSEFNVVEEINKQREENRDVTYANESSPGVVKPNYSPITEEDKENIENVGGKDVVVVPGGTTKPQQPSQPSEKPTNPTTEPTVPVETSPTVEEDKESAEEKIEDMVEDAQALANQGAADGKEDAMNGKSKRDLTGKSVHYVNAYNTSYDAWKKVYDAQHSKEEDVPVVEETEPVAETEPTNPTDPEVIEEVIEETTPSTEELNALRDLLVGTTNTADDTINIQGGFVKVLH